jgi:hypothetical protein
MTRRITQSANFFTSEVDLHLKWEIVKCYFRRTALYDVETQTLISCKF